MKLNSQPTDTAASVPVEGFRPCQSLQEVVKTCEERGILASGKVNELTLRIDDGLSREGGNTIGIIDSTVKTVVDIDPRQIVVFHTRTPSVICFVTVNTDHNNFVTVFAIGFLKCGKSFHTPFAPTTPEIELPKKIWIECEKSINFAT